MNKRIMAAYAKMSKQIGLVEFYESYKPDYLWDYFIHQSAIIIAGHKVVTSIVGDEAELIKCRFVANHMYRIGDLTDVIDVLRRKQTIDEILADLESLSNP